MRRYSWGTGVLVLALNATAGAVTVDFEEFDQPPYSLGPESYYNGSDGAGGFTTEGAFFNNSYSTIFDSWTGWAVSNTTDTTTPGIGNQYSAIPGHGAGASEFYGVAYTFNPGDAFIELPVGMIPQSVAITNTTYAALSMRDGDGFAKKFGGPTGNDPDWFLLTVTGLDARDITLGTVEFYLADFRFADNGLDYIVDTWTTVDLTPLGAAHHLSFGLTSSDNGPFGMNTPAFVALDGLVYVPEPATLSLLVAAGLPAVRRRNWKVLSGVR